MDRLGPTPPAGGITVLLRAAASGDEAGASQLLDLLYEDLRRLAESRMRRTPPGNTLQPTALVHEAYLRLIGGGDSGWSGRAHFFGAAARAMREILVDQARRKGAVKHGGGLARADLDRIEVAFEDDGEELLALDAALRKLETRDAGKARIVMLRYFAGLSVCETAAAIGVSERTVEREWRFIKAWLRRELSGLDTNTGAADG